MITNTGKNIIAKYLLGHTASYASHIAVGCGSEPNSVGYLFTDKTNLDFEMFRVPIISRGYVKEDGLNYVVFTAELPTTERYGITELGIYSAGSNPEAGAADSKIIHAFSTLENWEQHKQTTASEIATISSALDEGDNIISVTENFFRVSSDNATFTNTDRLAAQEVPRFLDSSVVVRGNTAEIIVDDDGNLTPDDSVSSHIHLANVSYNFDENSPADELRLAFSLVNKEIGIPAEDFPDEVRIAVHFVSGEQGQSEYAYMDIRLQQNQDGVDFETNRYFVVTKQLQELRKSVGFSWNQVTTVKIYTSVIVDNAVSENYFIAYDGLRLENNTDIHPLYGLTGYSVVQNATSLPIIKGNNSSSFVEFRFAFELDPFAVS